MVMQLEPGSPTKIVDENTVPSRARVIRDGHGVANFLSWTFRGIGGLAVFGQTVLNMEATARTCLSTKFRWRFALDWSHE